MGGKEIPELAPNFNRLTPENQQLQVCFGDTKALQLPWNPSVRRVRPLIGGPCAIRCGAAVVDSLR